MEIKFLKRKKKYKKENFEIRPENYWRGVLAIFLAFMIFVSFFGGRLFKQVDTDDSLLSNINANLKREKREKINSVLNYFNEREEKSERIINSPAPVVDPSL